MTEAELFGFINPLVIFVIIFIISRTVFSAGLKKEREFCDKCKQIRPGMSKFKTIQLLGDRYSPSYLQDGVERLEWSWRRQGVFQTLTRKIIIIFECDKAVEIITENID